MTLPYDQDILTALHAIDASREALDLAWSAQENANDTHAFDCDHPEWQDTFRRSLELLVADERDASVRACFDRIGFKY